MFKLMIVEDDLSLNKLMTTILKKKGYEVISMTNAVDALDYFYDNVIDLIVSDIMMPNMDGFEFAESVREINQNIPILFVTYGLRHQRQCEECDHLRHALRSTAESGEGCRRFLPDHAAV